MLAPFFTDCIGADDQFELTSRLRMIGFGPLVARRPRARPTLPFAVHVTNPAQSSISAFRFSKKSVRR